MTRLRLEEFGRPAAAGDVAGAAAGDVAADPGAEAARLSAYEAGYAAGWDDAVAAAATDRARIAEDLGRNLRDLSFTFHEARTNLLRGLEPLLRSMVDTVLPDLARTTLGPAVLAQLSGAARGLLDRPVEILVAPANLAAVEAALAAAGTAAIPVRLVAEPAQAEGQVHFRFPDGGERALDLPALLAAIRTLVDDFLAPPPAPGAEAGPSSERLLRHG